MISIVRENMSVKSLQAEKYFIHLLFSTTKEQAKALIYTLTPGQTLAVCEIILNISNLSNSPQIRTELIKRRPLIKKLTEGKLKLKQRLTYIQDHYRQVLGLLCLVKNKVLSLI